MCEIKITEKALLSRETVEVAMQRGREARATAIRDFIGSIGRRPSSISDTDIPSVSIVRRIGAKIKKAATVSDCGLPASKAA